MRKSSDPLSRRFGRAIPHAVSIQPSNNGGFIVIVGCARLVYEFIPELLDDLKQYLGDPHLMIAKYDRESAPTLQPNAVPRTATGSSPDLWNVRRNGPFDESAKDPREDVPCPQP